MKTAGVLFAIAPSLLFGYVRDKTLERIAASQEVLQEITNAPDHGVPRDMLAHAQCVAVIPAQKRAAFVFGAKYGKGIMVCRTSAGWSAPSTVILEGGSFGFQIGLGETDIVLVVRNRSGERKLMEDKFTFDAGAAGMLGPLGRSTQASTDAQMHAEILAYSRSRGLFAGIDIGGGTLRPDHGDNRDLYGPFVTHHEILLGEVKRPAVAQGFYDQLNRCAGVRGQAIARR